jgi:hypothetical protein
MEAKPEKCNTIYYFEANKVFESEKNLLKL